MTSPKGMTEVLPHEALGNLGKIQVLFSGQDIITRNMGGGGLSLKARPFKEEQK